MPGTGNHGSKDSATGQSGLAGRDSSLLFELVRMLNVVEQLKTAKRRALQQRGVEPGRFEPGGAEDIWRQQELTKRIVFADEFADECADDHDDYCKKCNEGGLDLVLCDAPGCTSVWHPGCAGRQQACEHARTHTLAHAPTRI